jgi:hypothetical protein|tara:strand:+ start:268 stop:534 length:267 start_codon:yes stop_codon:yes gene_type:complete
MIKLSNPPHTYIGFVPYENGRCFIGYGAGESDIKYGMKKRTSEEEFKTLSMWKMSLPSHPFAMTYRNANLSFILKAIEELKGEEIKYD